MTTAQNVSIVRIVWMLSVPAVLAVRNVPTSVPNAVNTAKTAQTAIFVLNAELATAVQAVRAAFVMNVHSAKCALTTSAYAEAAVPDVQSSVRNAEKSAKIVPMTCCAPTVKLVLTVSVVTATTAPNADFAKTAWNRFAPAGTAAPNVRWSARNAANNAKTVPTAVSAETAVSAWTVSAVTETSASAAKNAKTAWIRSVPAAKDVQNVPKSVLSVPINA